MSKERNVFFRRGLELKRTEKRTTVERLSPGTVSHSQEERSAHASLAGGQERKELSTAKTPDGIIQKRCGSYSAEGLVPSMNCEAKQVAEERKSWFLLGRRSSQSFSTRSRYRVAGSLKLGWVQGRVPAGLSSMVLQCSGFDQEGSQPCFFFLSWTLAQPRPRRSVVVPRSGGGKVSRSSYQRQELKLSEPVAWEQLEPPLPPVESATRVRAADLADGVSKQWLTNPRRCLLAKTKWPAGATSAKVVSRQARCPWDSPPSSSAANLSGLQLTCMNYAERQVVFCSCGGLDAKAQKERDHSGQSRPELKGDLILAIVLLPLMCDDLPKI